MTCENELTITRLQDIVVNQERRISTLERDLKRVLKEERKRELCKNIEQPVSLYKETQPW